MNLFKECSDMEEVQVISFDLSDLSLHASIGYKSVHLCKYEWISE